MTTNGLGGHGIFAERQSHAGDVNIDVEDTAVEIDNTEYDPTVLTANKSYGIYGLNSSLQGGATNIRARRSTIATKARSSTGIYGVQQGVGDINISVEGGSVTTEGQFAPGIYGLKGPGDGSIHIEVRNADVLTENTEGTAHAIYAQRPGPGAGNMDIVVVGGSATTHAAASHAIYGRQTGFGYNRVLVQGTTIATHGQGSAGVYGFQRRNGGSLFMDVLGGAFTTHGRLAHTIYGGHGDRFVTGTGDILIDVRDAVLETTSTEESNGITLSTGIYGHSYATGDIVILVRGGSIATAGAFSYGIYGVHRRVGDIYIYTGDGHTIATTGANGHGIVAYHYRAGDDRSITVEVAGDVDASGAGAYGVLVGQSLTSTTQAVGRAAPLDADGYRKHTVVVNGRVTGDKAGVFLSGGGRVVIGPRGFVGGSGTASDPCGTSRTAICAAGTTTVDGETLPRKLLVLLLPDGGPVSDLLDGLLVNEGGETLFAVNGVLLHDSSTGRTGLWAPNGWRDVTLVEDEDFAGEDNDFSKPERYVYRTAPRTAVYEALPGFLLRLDRDPGPGGERMRKPGSPLWVRVAGGTGAFEAERSTVDAEYEYDRFAIEAGMDFPLAEGLTAWAGGRLVSGSADVSAPTGGGKIDAVGHGLTFGAAWREAGGFYGNAGFTATWYKVDLSSANRGSLRTDADAFVHTLDLEAGRRFALNGKTSLTPRAWLNRSNASLSAFRDAVGARVSDVEANRLVGGAGAVVETELTLSGEDSLSLRGSLGAEHTLDGGETSVVVSGKTLKSEARNSRVLLGLGSTYRSGGMTLAGEFQMHGAGSKDTGYTGRVNLGIAF